MTRVDLPFEALLRSAISVWESLPPIPIADTAPGCLDRAIDRRRALPGRECFRCGGVAGPALAGEPAGEAEGLPGYRWLDFCWGCYSWLYRESSTRMSVL